MIRSKKENDTYSPEFIAKLCELVEIRPSGKVSASGWTEVHAIDRPDNSPSAGVSSSGVYRDNGTGESFSLFKRATENGHGTKSKVTKLIWNVLGKSPNEVREIAKERKPMSNGNDDPERMDRRWNLPQKWILEPMRTEAINEWCSRKDGIKPQIVVDSCIRVMVSKPYQICFPAFDSNGKVCGWQSANVDGSKYQLSDRKQGKYKTEPNSRDGLFIPLGFEAIRSARTVYWTEGPGDALAIQGILPDDGKEIAVTSLGGASGAPKHSLQLLKDKEVIVVSDADDPGIKGAAKRAKAAVGNGAVVRVIIPPYPIQKDHGKDMRDWIADGASYGDICELVRTTPEFSPADEIQTSTVADKRLGPGAQKKADAADIEPIMCARIFLAEHHGHEDGHRLRYYRGDFYRWFVPAWKGIPADEIRAAVALHLAKIYDGVRTSDVNNVMEFVRAITNTSSEFNLPCWLDGRIGDAISFRNGIVMLDDLIAEKSDCLRMHTPTWFSTTALPYEYDPAATCETWQSILTSNLENDAERILLLQEFVGYSLTNLMLFHTMLMLIGDGANGKSVFLAGLLAIVGRENCSTLSLDDLGHNFRLSRIVGKSVNVCADLSETSKACEGVLKKLISGDSIEFERKYKEPFSAVPTAKLIFSTNSLPQFYDRTNGIWRRLTVVPFLREVPEEEKVRGMDNPEWWQKRGELSGMFNWALAGLKRLLSQNGFTRSTVCEAATIEHRMSCNPASTFLDDEYVADPHDHTSKPEIYAAYHSFCIANGFKALGSAQFGKEIKKKFGDLKDIRINNGFERQRCYHGIRRKRTGDEPLEPTYEGFS